MSETITLKEHIDALFKANDEKTKAALASAEKAVDKAENDRKAWQSASNEWRGAMNDRERDFLTRREFYVMVTTLVVILGAVFALKV